MNERIRNAGLSDKESNELIGSLQGGDITKTELGLYYRMLNESEGKDIMAIRKRFYWIHWNYDEGEELTDPIIRRDVEDAKKADLHPGKHIVEAWEKRYNLNEEDGRLLNDIFLMSQAKAKAKETINQAAYHANLLFEELSRRLKVEKDILRTLLPSEMEAWLVGGIHPDLSELQRRCKQAVYLIEKDNVEVITDEVKIDSIISKDQDTVKASDFYSFSGQVACQGQAEGIVCVIKGAREMDTKKFIKGSILVAVNTSPNMIRIIRDSSAIVTDIGGITSHAASISRELGKPCIVGTKIATRVLEDGDLINVDAEKGIVRLIKRRRRHKR